ncbi:MAG: hypothetical protein Alpg2KO_27680 [Alphaproteobacteria bacterium]
MLEGVFIWSVEFRLFLRIAGYEDRADCIGDTVKRSEDASDFQGWPETASQMKTSPKAWVYGPPAIRHVPKRACDLV